MDRDQFDRLSRLVAAAGTRRDALRLLVAGAVAGAAIGGDDAAARKRQRGESRQRKKVRSQQLPVQCPSTCNQNCSNKPLHPGVNLTKCDLNERDLDGVNLSSSNVTKACFGDSSLRYANFRGANVSGACFCGADLTGADFRGTKVTTQQLACATVACNTILPNGKPAVACAKGQTCCNGVCVNTGSDPNNCGACGKTCGACQFCNFGKCQNLADGKFDCARQPLVPAGGGVCSQGLCTPTANTGICDLGFCNCGPHGVYDEDANVCVCDQDGVDTCAEDGDCCEVEQTCLANGEYCSDLLCFDCTPGESEAHEPVL